MRQPQKSSIRSKSKLVRARQAAQAEPLARRLMAYLPLASDFASALNSNRDHSHPYLHRGELIASLPRLTMLLHICVAADRYLADPLATGRWLLAPQAQTQGLSPAEMINHHGVTGLNFVLDAMPFLMPARPAQPLTTATLAELQVALGDILREHGLDPDEVRLAPAPTDEELEAELASVV